jgi:hypothetical protein
MIPKFVLTKQAFINNKYKNIKKCLWDTILKYTLTNSAYDGRYKRLKLIVEDKINAECFKELCSFK